MYFAFIQPILILILWAVPFFFHLFQDEVGNLTLRNTVLIFVEENISFFLDENTLRKGAVKGIEGRLMNIDDISWRRYRASWAKATYR